MKPTVASSTRPAAPADLPAGGMFMRPLLFFAALMAVLPTAMAEETPAVPSEAPVALETLTITARRRSEDAQSVPAPTSSVRGDTLATNRITQVQDLQQALPSLNA